MELVLTGKDARNMVYYGSNTRLIHLFKNCKKVSEMFIQNSNLFTTNLHSIIQRLEENEIDKVSYKPTRDENITIQIIEGELTIKYQTDNTRMYNQLQEFLEKFK